MSRWTKEQKLYTSDKETDVFLYRFEIVKYCYLIIVR